MFSLLSRLFGTGNSVRPAPGRAPDAFELARAPCPTCERQILPGSCCPFCQSQAFSKEMFKTVQLEHAPQEKLEALGGVVVATEAARRYGAKGFLYVYQGKNRGQIVLLAEKAVTIGRDAATNQLGLNDANVSARHCEIRPVGAGFEIVDLEAKNGTFLNERPVKQAALANGDVITIGESRIYLGIS